MQKCSPMRCGTLRCKMQNVHIGRVSVCARYLMPPVSFRSCLPIRALPKTDTGFFRMDCGFWLHSFDGSAAGGTTGEEVAAGGWHRHNDDDMASQTQRLESSPPHPQPIHNSISFSSCHTVIYTQIQHIDSSYVRNMAAPIFYNKCSKYESI